MNKISISEAISFGWKKFIEKPLFFFLVAIICFFLPSLVGALMNPLSRFLGVFWVDLLSMTSMVLVSIAVSIGSITIFLKSYNNEKTSFNDFFVNLNLLWKMIVSYFLYWILVFAGLLFFIIPGIILAIRFLFVDFFIVDKKIGPISAFKKSYQITKGFSLKILGLLIVFLLLNVLGIMLLFLGVLIAFPVVMLARVFVYHRLKEIKGLISSKDLIE